MCGVFDDSERVLSGNLVKPIQIHRQAGEMNRHDRPCALGDCGFHSSEIDIAGGQLDIDKDRNGTQAQHHIGARCKAHRRHDDLITFADARGHEGDLECRSSGCERANLASAEIGRQRAFELGNVRPGGNPPGAQHFAHLGNGLLIDRGPTKWQV